MASSMRQSAREFFNNLKPSDLYDLNAKEYRYKTIAYTYHRPLATIEFNNPEKTSSFLNKIKSLPIDTFLFDLTILHHILKQFPVRASNCYPVIKESDILARYTALSFGREGSLPCLTKKIEIDTLPKKSEAEYQEQILAEVLSLVIQMCQRRNKARLFELLKVQEGKNKETVLALASNYLSVFKCLLDFVNTLESKQSEAIYQAANGRNETIFHQLAGDIKKLSQFQSLCDHYSMSLNSRAPVEKTAESKERKEAIEDLPDAASYPEMKSLSLEVTGPACPVSLLPDGEGRNTLHIILKTNYKPQDQVSAVKSFFSTLQTIPEKIKALSARNSHGNTPLHYAAASATIQAMEVIFLGLLPEQKNELMTQKNSKGQIPLFFLLVHKEMSPHLLNEWLDISQPVPIYELCVMFPAFLKLIQDLPFLKSKMPVSCVPLQVELMLFIRYMLGKESENMGFFKPKKYGPKREPVPCQYNRYTPLDECEHLHG